MNSKIDMPFVPKSLTDLLTEISMIRDFAMKCSKLDYHIRYMEAEFKKIEAFQHELPHSMQLMKEGIELLKKERSRLREIEERRAFVTQEFMPVPSAARERGESSQNNHRNKKDDWMNQAPRLWNTTIQFHNGGNDALSFKSRGNNGGQLKRAYSDMEQVKGKGIAVEEISMPVHVEPIDMSDPEFKHPKKRRRCWSPDLHKRFIDALVELGGPIEATPRQIRDKMNVEGLTNDEVKSHLQKYRLHIRKLAAGELPEENLEEPGGSAANVGGGAADEVDKNVNQD